MIFERYKAAFKVSPQWNGREGKAVKDLLASLGADWTVEKLDRCVQFKLLSANKSATERPAARIPSLTAYYEAPLNEFNKPDFKILEKWERHNAAKAGKAKAEAKKVSRPAVGPTISEIKIPEPAPSLHGWLRQQSDLNIAAWLPIVGKLKDNLNAETVKLWLNPCRFHAIGGESLYVRVPNHDFLEATDKFGSGSSTYASRRYPVSSADHSRSE